MRFGSARSPCLLATHISDGWLALVCLCAHDRNVLTYASTAEFYTQ